MANINIVLRAAVSKTDKPKMKGNVGEKAIKTLISKAFATRNMLHLAHWNTKMFSAHLALGDLYDEIISDIDDIVEVFQGKYGLLEGLSAEGASLPEDVCKHVKDEAAWVEENRTAIACGTTAIENLVDNLIGHYHKTVYKLENLH